MAVLGPRRLTDKRAARLGRPFDPVASELFRTGCGSVIVAADALPLADRIELTEVHAAPNGNTRFPAFDRSEWDETFREAHPPEGKNPGFDFVTLLRKAGTKRGGN